jgi:peptidoglycan/xylan/chitin deacetylase (PgdA/CDA1 family)
LLEAASLVLGGPPLRPILESVNGGRGGFILAYHNPPRETVEAHVLALASMRPVPLDEIIERLRAGRPTRGIYSITVDDGVGSTTRELAGLARANRIPVTFYLPTAYLDTGRPYWFHRVPALFEKAVRGVVTHLGRRFDLGRQEERKELLSLVLTRCRQLPPGDAEALADEVIARCLSEGLLSPEAELGPAPISWEEVREMAGDEMVFFESHSVNHPNMAVLPERQIEWELRESKRKIEEATGRPCRHFCYPFGNRAEIGTVAPAVCEKLTESAVTMERGRIGGRSPWHLPRVPLYAQDSRRLAAFKVAAAR